MPKPPDPASLTAYLKRIAADDSLGLRGEIATWKLDEATFRRIVVEPYRGLYADYARAFDERIPEIADALTRGRPEMLTAHRHFAGEPNLPLPAGRVRWALPTMYPSAVAAFDGAPLDAVFVPDGDRWRSLIGLDRAVLDRVRALDLDCELAVSAAGAPSRCTDAAWLVVDAALRTDAPRFAHACRLAGSLCGNPAP